jgi:hypothetical protein
MNSVTPNAMARAKLVNAKLRQNVRRAHHGTPAPVLS